MENRSFVALLVGASAATFAGVFLAMGTPAVSGAQPVADEPAAIVAPPSDRFEMPEMVKPASHVAIEGSGTHATGSSSGSSVYYSGCKEVRNLGKAPLYSGQPGYRSEMDGDGDGIACEPHTGSSSFFGGGGGGRRRRH